MRDVIIGKLLIALIAILILSLAGLVVWYISVSYTHLDVDKRQGYIRKQV